MELECEEGETAVAMFFRWNRLHHHAEQSRRRRTLRFVFGGLNLIYFARCSLLCYCSGTVLVLFWYCSGTVLVLFWYCSSHKNCCSTNSYVLIPLLSSLLIFRERNWRVLGRGFLIVCGCIQALP